MINKDMFKKNIGSLHVKNEKLKSAMLQNEAYDGEGLSFGVEIIEDRKVLYVIKEDMQYQLDSLYDSNIVLDRWVGQFINVNFRSRYLLFGLGNGMYVRKILERIDPESIVIILEPCLQILYTVFTEFDLSDLLENSQVHLCVDGIEGVTFRETLDKYLTFEDLDGAICRAYLNYPMLFPQKYKEFNDTIKFVSNSLDANESVMVRFGEAYFQNSIHNYPFLAKGKSLISLYKKIPREISVIIVAAGPSLDRNMYELEKAKNKSIIIAVDSAVRALLSHNIIPDMMISVDALKWSKHFEEDGVKRVPIICNLTSNHNALKNHTANMFFLNDLNPFIQNFHDEIEKIFPYVASGGSVATDAFAFAERLKVKTIILVGQDLAFTDDKTHSSSTARGERNLKVEKDNGVEVEGIDGEPVFSSYEFMIYKDWFEKEIEKNEFIKVIDATEGGAKIKGTEIKTLKEAIEQECNTEIDFAKIMEEVPNRFTQEEQVRFFEHMRQLPNKMKELRNIVQKNIRYFEKMLVLTKQNKYTSSEMRRLVDMTTDYCEQIEQHPSFYYINSRMFKDATVNEIYKKQEDDKAEVQYSIKQALEYYRLIDDTIKMTIPYVVELMKQEEKNEI